MGTSYNMNAKLTTQPPGGLSTPYNGLTRQNFMRQIYSSPKKQDILFHQILANNQCAKRILVYQNYNLKYLQANYGRYY